MKLCPLPMTTDCLYFRCCTGPTIIRDRKERKGTPEKGQQGFLLMPESSVKGGYKQRKDELQLVSS